MGLVGKSVQLVRKSRVLHRLGYARVWCQSKILPPPPRGVFPPVWLATKRPHGLLALGGTLTAETLLAAYAKGIYPFYDKHPVEWLSCNPRMVLFLEKMKLRKGLRPLIKSNRYGVTFDTAFEEVVRSCSDREWTWLVPERIDVALELHRRGQAHSVEVWNHEGRLVGGLFGVDMGRLFVSESAFSREKGAMRVAFTYLNCHLQHWGFLLNDVLAFEEHFRRLGYEEIPRKEYIKMLPSLVTAERRLGKWVVDRRLNVGGWIPSRPGSQLNNDAAVEETVSGK